MKKTTKLTEDQALRQDVRRVGEKPIEPLTEEAVAPLEADFLRNTTARWATLLLLYEGKAHRAREYSNWGDYAWEVLGIDSSEGYRLLAAARVERALLILKIENEGLRVNHARHLAPLIDQPDNGFEKVVRRLLADAEGGWKGITGEDAQRAADRWTIPRYVAAVDGDRERRVVETRVRTVVQNIADAASVLARGEDVTAGLRDLPEAEAKLFLSRLDLLRDAVRAGLEGRGGRS